ncbi:MAG: D-alanyl-D-alanine carboxypeptidase family protein [Pseudomonadota bacterium]
MKIWNALLGLFCLVLTGPAAAALPVPPAPALEARAWLLLDVQSGQTLAARNPDARIEPASLTKLMTAYIVFSALRDGRLALNQPLVVSEKAWRTEGSRMFLDPKRPVLVEDLLKGMIVQSGNDACIVLAEAIAGSEDGFAALMNQTARRLGMSQTRFVNATGLPHPQHYSTARDLARLSTALIRDFPEFYKLYAMKEYTYNGIKQPNRNRLLWLDPNVDGVKTGHTESAGYCLIASSQRDQRRLLSVVVGTSSDAARAMESQKLLNYGFQFFETARLYSANQAVARIRIYKGSSNEVQAGFQQDFYVTVPRGSANRIKAELHFTNPMLAPVSRGQKVANLRLSLDGQPLGDFPLVALQGVSVANIIGRGWDSLLLLFK